MARYTVLRAPFAREYGPEVDVSKFAPGASINVSEALAARWVRRGVLVLTTELKRQDENDEPDAETESVPEGEEG